MIQSDGTPRTAFERALVYATQIHETQVRKGGRSVPYVSHLLGVAALVLQDGGDVTQAMGALLHDAAEDQGPAHERLADIETRFGRGVAEIVRGCTDSFEDPKPPWRERKEAYIAELPGQPPETLRVSLADKLYNARTILDDCRVHGVGYLENFNGKRDGTLWYYRTLLETFRATTLGPQSPMVDELGRVVDALEHLVTDS
jgi:(p)ppGpp synthase/HD superfamily hydrolase